MWPAPVLRPCSQHGHRPQERQTSQESELLAAEFVPPAPLFFYWAKLHNVCGNRLGARATRPRSTRRSLERQLPLCQDLTGKSTGPEGPRKVTKLPGAPIPGQGGSGPKDRTSGRYPQYFSILNFAGDVAVVMTSTTWLLGGVFAWYKYVHMQC